LLILSRNIGEILVIGDLNITVTGIFDNKVYLGIANKGTKSAFSTLNAKQEEEITVTENVRIKILQIRGRQIRLGIKAPPDIHILRDNLEPK
jgi:sRNA-binding carbon storage regulator CsrA